MHYFLNFNLTYISLETIVCRLEKKLSGRLTDTQLMLNKVLKPQLQQEILYSRKF